MVSVRMCVPILRANVAGTASLKKNQICPPWPERDRSKAAGRFIWRHVSKNVAESSCHVALSKSPARKKQG
jgi:hypothetical protein